METKEELLEEFGECVREYVKAHGAVADLLPGLTRSAKGEKAKASRTPTKKSLTTYAEAEARLERASRKWDQIYRKLQLFWLVSDQDRRALR